jgi:hypothetical protein
MPIWISSPVKVRKMGVIQKIINSIFKGKAIDDIQDDDLLFGTRQKIAPWGYKVLLLGNQLQILPSNTPPYPSNDSLNPVTPPATDLYWQAVLNAYGVVRPGVSMIALENPYWETEILGTIAFNPLDDRFLIFNIDPDTLPQNSLSPVNSIIDPLQKWPDNGVPVAASGQRYLIVEDIPEQTAYVSNTNNWPGLVDGARANDIIEFNGTNWTVAFDSNSTKTVQFVTNLTTAVQYRFVDNGWMKSYEGYYPEGDWRVIL